ncbi:MAG TPA: HAD family phosphatase [Streptosporangiaceae bacterium]|nr:HAD family phosphatase [Streptosporangiaceae bacterium]
MPDSQPELAEAPGAARGALQAVMFDMDGLLVDTEPLWFEVESAVMTRLGGDWGAGDQEQLVGGSLERTLDYLLGKATRPRSRATVAGWMVGGMVELLGTRPITALPGALRLLGEVAAAGVPHALVTSSERVIMEAVLRQLKVSFPVTVCGEDVAATKPDPEPYRLAAARLGADPRRCAVLEDSPNGVAAAEAAGCLTVAVPNLVPIPAARGRVVVASLTEVSLAVLAGLVAAR